MNPANEEAAELVELWLSGVLDADGRHRLNALLADPALAAAARAQARDGLVLAAWFDATPAATVAERARTVLAQARPSGLQRTLDGVQRRLDRRRRSRAWWTLPTVAAACAAALAVTLLVLRDPPTAATLGSAAQIERQGRPLVAAAGSGLQIGDRLLAAGGSPVLLVWPDGSRIELDAGGSLELLSATPKRLRLSGGTLRAEVAAQPRGQPLSIVTDQAVATVVGTRFRLDDDAAGSRLGVDHGVVRLAPVDAASESIEVAAGEMASVAQGRLHPGPSLQALERGLLLRWRWQNVDEVEDASGHSHVGRITHAALVPGINGPALRCGGRSAVFAAGSAALVPERFTVALWLRRSAATEPALLVQHHDTLAGEGISLGLSAAGRLELRLLPGPQVQEPLVCAADLSDLDRWLHLAATWDGQRLALWRDGRPLASVERTGLRVTWPVAAVQHPMVIGAGFIGDLGEVRVYDRALDADELLRLGMRP